MVKYWLLMVLLLGGLSRAWAQEEGVGPDRQYYPVHDFRSDLLVYDEPTKTYIPFLVELHNTKPAVSAFIDLESNRRYKLLVSTRKDAYLFINAALKRKLTANKWQVFDIDSLYRAYRPTRANAVRPEIFLTIYGAPGIDDKELYIGYPKSATARPVILSDDGLSVRPRPQSPYDDFFAFGMLFLLATHAFLYSYNRRAFLRFYDPRDLLSLRVREESFLVNKPLSRITMLFIINLSFVMAFLLLFVQSRNIDVFASRVLLMEGERFPVLLLDFLLLSGLVFLLLTGKYVFLYLLGSLYKLEKITNVHFFKVLQSSMLFFTAVVLLAAVLVANVPDFTWMSGYLLLPFVAFYMARLALLYLVISSMIPIKNLYLFSYLCLVELIPMIVGVRFAL